MKYKISNHNYFIEYKDSVVGINLLVRRMFAIDKEKYILFESFKENIDKLKEKNVLFFNVLYKFGIIIDRDFSEFDVISLENRKMIFSDKFYRLTIIPTLNCNFSCWYCYEKHPKDKMTKETMELVINHINYMISVENITGLDLDWFGGEPLLGFKSVIYPLGIKAKSLALTNNIAFRSSATTNGYLINKEMALKFKELSLNTLQITLDGTEEKHNKIKQHGGKLGSYKRIIENINLLCSLLNEPNIVLRINYSSDVLDDITKIIDEFPKANRNKIEVLFQQVWQVKDKESDNFDHVESLKDTFEEEGFKVRRELINEKGYRCYADKLYQSVVNYDGKVFKCTARDFYSAQNDGLLTESGNIDWNKKKLHDRVWNSTFTNRECQICNLLPACMGPCSQKLLELKKKSDFLKLCNRKGIETGLRYMLEKFYDNNIA